MYKYYFAHSDNLNAKNLYLYCKKLGKGYPFVRAHTKAFLPDHKLVVTNQNAQHKYGLLTVEHSLGHVVPGVVFEVYDVDMLDIFSEDFDKVEVCEFGTGRKISVLLNKVEEGNLLRRRKAKFPNNRKKLLRKAVEWRNLDKFDACFESAICNYNYPIIVKNFFIPNTQSKLIFKEVVEATEYNILENASIEMHNTTQHGIMVYSNSLKLPGQLKELDAKGFTRTVVEVMDSKHNELHLAWYIKR